MEKQEIISELFSQHPYSKDELTRLYDNVEKHNETFPDESILSVCSLITQRARSKGTDLIEEFWDYANNR